MTPQQMQEGGIARVERNIVYAMHSGLALLPDAYIPAEPNGYGAVHICGSGWSAPLSPDNTSRSAPCRLGPLTTSPRKTAERRS